MTSAKTAFRPCPVCGGKSVEVLLHMPFILPEGSPLPSAYDIAACPQCGFVYADTKGSQDDYDLYYRQHSKYENSKVATGGNQDAFDRCRIGNQADRIAATTPLDARILDIGCASGGLLLNLRDRGYRSLHGFDGAPGCISQLKAQGIDATLGVLSNLPASSLPGPFDVIILSHVLEHVLDLDALMAPLKQLLAANGSVYVETPDAARYNAHTFVPFYFFDCEHINHFDHVALDQLASRHGLRPGERGSIDLEVAGGLLYPAIWTWMHSGDSYAPTQANSPAGLPTTMRRYIEASAQRGSPPMLRELKESGFPVIIWGAGAFAQRLFSSSVLGECNIVGIVDNDSNKQGKVFLGHTIGMPATMLSAHPEAVVLVVAAIQFEAIAAEARRLSPNCRVIKFAESTAHG